MAQQGGQQQQQGGDSNDMMWAAAFFAFVLVLLWLAKDSWLPFVFQLKHYELKFINHFFTVNQGLMNTIHELAYYPQKVSSDKYFYLMLDRVGKYYSIPVAILLFTLAIIIYVRNPGTKFNRTYNITNFKGYQQSLFPQISPSSRIDLVKTDITKGPWASSYTPLQFAQKFKLLDIIENKEFNPLLGELAKVAKLREGKARQVFAAQLGPMWQGADKLPPHTKALFAAFNAVANKDREAGLNLLKQFNQSVLSGKNTPDFSGVNNILNKYKDSKLTKKVESRHAYVITVMAALLELARTDGVLATADFLWLKPIDRKLWYMLNNVGRRAAFPEVAGAIAHWRIESRMQRKLTTPMIEEAVKALRIGLNEVIYPQDD